MPYVCVEEDVFIKEGFHSFALQIYSTHSVGTTCDFRYLVTAKFVKDLSIIFI
jgi:hypothetical protein